MPDGYQVDPAVLTRAAESGASIARDARPMVKELTTALDDVSAGTSGSQSASVATSTAGPWTDALRGRIEQIQSVGDRLKQTADRYLRQEEAIAQTISRIPAAPAAEPSGDGRISAILDGVTRSR